MIPEKLNGSLTQINPTVSAPKSGGTGIVGGIVTGLLGAVSGGTLGIITAVLPVVINAVAGMFKDHTPEFYFDSGLDKMHQYLQGSGGNKQWFADQLDKARKGVKGLIAAKHENYSAGAPIYYLPYLAFPITFRTGKGSVETWEGDRDLQKLACALYAEGYLSFPNMYFPNRPDYNLTDGIQAIRNSDIYQNMVANNIDGAGDKERTDKINDTISTVNTKAVDYIKKYWYIAAAIPVILLIRLITGRR